MVCSYTGNLQALKIIHVHILANRTDSDHITCYPRAQIVECELLAHTGHPR